MIRKPIGLRKPALPAKKSVNLDEVAANASFGKVDHAVTPATVGEQALPFYPGQVLRTDKEKRELAVLGVTDKTALPGDFAEKVAAHKAAQAAELQEELDRAAQSGKKVKMPKEIRIEDLSPERQEELRQAIHDAQAEMHNLVELRKQQAEMAGLHPSVRAAAAAAAPSIEIFDSRTKGAEAQPAVARPAKASAPSAKPAPPPDAAVDADDMPFATGATDAPSHCPRCHFPVGQVLEIKPTREDIISFELSVTSVNETPFVKTYSFFGGKSVVAFRSVPMRYVDMARKQHRLDRLAGRIMTVEEGNLTFASYMTILSLYQIDQAGESHIVYDEVDKALMAASSNPNEDTPLVELLDSFMHTPPFSNESMWRTLRTTWQQFDELVQYLEAQAANPSFWRAIET